MTEHQIPKGARIFNYSAAFNLERGGQIENLEIAYHCYGQLNASKNNVIWVCHALTANSEVEIWWPGMLGKDKVFDPQKHFIVCANVIGSYYGSSSPRSINPQTNIAYGLDFPLFTVSDIAQAHWLLAQELGIEEIMLCIGGSFGGHQALEMAILNPQKIKQLALLACSARETAWSIAIHETQRMALENDPTFKENSAVAGKNGLATARAIGMLNYRSIATYIETQTNEDEAYDNLKASSYQRYQGQKLCKRFHAHCYWYLTKCLDSHHIGRNRGSIESVLSELNMPSLVVAIQNDMLIPKEEQIYLAEQLPNAIYSEIISNFGHDGFLIEVETISTLLRSHLNLS